MTGRSTATIGCAASALAMAAAAAAGSAPGGERSRGVVEDCSTRSEATFPGAFTSPGNLAVGPLVLVGAGGTPAYGYTSHGNKFPLLVRNGHRVKVEVPARMRRAIGLAYGPLPQGLTRLRDTHRVVTFIACRRGQRSGSSADGQPVTFWSGGVLAASPRCVPLLVWVDAERSPRRAVIRLGVSRCA